MRNLHVYLLTAILLIIGFSLFYAKVKYLGLPMTPNQEETVWSVEARVEFDGQRRSASANLIIPNDPGQFIKLDEYFISRNFGLNVETHAGKRVAEWSIRRAQGPQRLYYQLELAPRAEFNQGKTSSKIPAPATRPDFPESLSLAIEGMLNKVRGESADIFTFVSQLLVHLNEPSPDAEVELIRKGLTPGTDAWVNRIINILATRNITSRLVRGISLQDGRANQPLQPWLEVHNGDRWEGFDPLSGNKGYPVNFLRWSIGNDPVLKVERGKNAQVLFSVSKRAQALMVIAHDRAGVTKSPLIAWSLFKLPMNTQYVYRVLIMLPLGALVVVFMRTVIGIPTFGTFMPILIALAFRETHLLWGIGLFCLIVGAGLSLRFYLNNLKLLLVARLGAVMTLVVMIMLAISLLSNKLGMVQGFSIALFPIVIMTMVIERMSITWDETGPAEAFTQGIGSLAIAVLGYLVMYNKHLQHLIFVFPELLLVVLALCLVMGTYTGYRLNELFRFRDLALPSDDDHAGTGPKAP
jgi:hypothetical protein